MTKKQILDRLDQIIHAFFIDDGSSGLEQLEHLAQELRHEISLRPQETP
jgi:hypothetical protein